MVFENNFDPVLLSIGPLEIRWYGALFATGILLAYYFLKWIFKREKFSATDLDSVIIYLIIGLIVGARLGNVLFYNPEYFLKHPLEIVMIWKGGLASHGAAIGVLCAYLIWIKVHKVGFSKYPDFLVLAFPIASAFVRFGNFFNSEIVGIPTQNSQYGVVFKKLGEDFPRHPSQLYEAVQNILIFALMFFIYIKWNKKLPKLGLFFIYVFVYFLSRFVLEFWKVKDGLPQDYPLSMGQILSIVPIVISLGYLAYARWKNK